ncbi:ROK family protein [Paenibacillus sp. JCM 10914]|uniref:ROK family protein n=1 Tax=Paenibacillus sp. JCM 10914 TaxID=1236974 RepID=UPI0003CC3163|nr:ROK family protein [Paenibacillus sp. JCM 10914]GAE04436.1 ROK family protein [Paenibacillus sp. JCM 10914]
MFGLGAGLRFPSERLICLTLGTGLGSAFIEHGRIVSGRKGIPSSGMLFAEPFEEGIVDSYFGRRGILKLASERGLLTEGVDVVDLAATAAGGDTSRLELFRTYGRRMGEMLLPYISEFGPSRLILGGQISRSLPLWDQSLSQALGEHAIPVHCLDQDGMSTVFMGIEQLFGDMENEPYVPLFNK